MTTLSGFWPHREHITRRMTKREECLQYGRCGDSFWETLIGHRFIDAPRLLILVESGLARLVGTSVTHPSGMKAGDYIDKLRELETTARTKKIGAWANSQPDLLYPVIDEQVEEAGSSRWIERGISFGLGVVVVGAAWFVTRLRGSRA
ncbi:MAG: hypothetical protein EXS36_17565 [Pedosphaera sp.]|nr:hypothetical protein [Pedosphaera sp.]